MALRGRVGYIIEDAKALPVCKVGTLLTHDGIVFKSNFCVA